MPSSDAHALVIGISHYQHLPRLPTTRDAEDLAAALCDPQLTGYPAANVRVLRDEEATRPAILDGLEELACRAGVASDVVLYFSGHGSRAGDGDLVPYAHFLLPVEARNATLAELRDTAICSAELSARLAAIGAGRLTVILDCCRAAALIDRGVLARGRRCAVLAAASGDGVAYIPEPGQPHSLFTSALLRGLRSEAARGGGLPVRELYDSVAREVVARRPGQRPVLLTGSEEVEGERSLR